ncbi:MAG TPA: right-handed parallel beta-helix repeat-containing protein [Thermoguttaceae bacterium]|nr:right-handed parallel beta-helix repeat-containing protein [Thermoguttaceae bacterium]
MRPAVTAAIVLTAIAWGSCVQPGVAEQVKGDVYVALDGRDDAPGTAERPFATVARARNAVREKTAAGLAGDLTVLIRGGTYFLDEPLVFTPDDSGTERHAVSYAAWGDGTPILSGGRRITGWAQGDADLWQVTLPEVKRGKWNFRDLFVDGARAVRARTPNRSAEEYCFRLVDAEITKDLKTHTLTVGPGVLQPWSHLDDVEVIVLKNWATLHKRVESVDPATGKVVLRGPHVDYFGGNRPRKGGGCFFENAPEMLDEPGEWYLDRQTGVLRYWPLEGQDVTRCDVSAPVLGHVLEIAGTPDRPVRNLHFRGLAVMHNHLPLPPEGHHGRQAAFRYGADGITGGLPCVVRWTHATGCSFTAGRIAHTGGSGIDLGEGCRANRIEGNAVFDLAGNGINVGGPDDEKLVPKENRIANNYVHRSGEVYYGACAIWAGFAQRTTIEHNLVCDHPYTGISIGWQWNDSPTVAREYLVRYNHVYDVMKQVCDGGAIYSLGYQPGTVLLRNHLHDVHRSRYAIAAPNNGIFLDQGSKAYLIEENAIYRTAGRPVRHNQNKPEWHTWKDNLLTDGDLPPDSAEALKRVEAAGLEPAWREKLLDGRGD